MPKNTYRVIDGPLSVRRDPSGTWLKSYATGFEFIADSDTEKIVNGYVWIQHDEGWSAKQTQSQSQQFLEKVDDTIPSEEPDTPAEIRQLKTNREVRVREAPTLSAQDIRFLAEGEIIETQSDSRTERDGYIWWQHKDGWSASQSLDGRWIFMEIVSVPVESTPVETETSETTSTAATSTPAVPTPASAVPIATPEIIKLQASTDVRIRSDADLGGTFIKWMPAGTIVECNASSQVTNDDYIWLHHKDGWSAWKNVAGSTIFLVEAGTITDAVLMTPNGPDVTTLPHLKTLIKRLPVDLDDTYWWQYFGNNVYAYENGLSWGYDRYAQGLHSGLDFGNNNAGVPVYAAFDCVFTRNDRYGLQAKSGVYTVIYQHLMNVPDFQVGQKIAVNTKIGELDPTPNLRHLHFEIRYKGAWIINPLLFMSDEMVEQIITKFKPGPRYFYESGAWKKWLTPMDQPVIKLGGPVIGPTAGTSGL